MSLLKEPSSSTPEKQSLPADVPGERRGILDAAEEMALAFERGLDPIKQIHMHFVSIHPFADNPRRQIEAHHYCSHLNDEVQQCVIYDTDGPNARLIGVEFMISERLFKTLPAREKRLWHSHEFEVCGGVIVMPGVPGAVEKEIMRQLAKTYGKTWHFWQFDRGDVLPLGPPKLQAALLSKDMIDEKVLKLVEQKNGFKRVEKEMERKDISGPEGGSDHDADMLRKNKGLRFNEEEFDIEGK